MAATPMAMPSADSPARSLRVRNPTVDRRARSEGRSFLTARVSVVVMAGRPRRRAGRSASRQR